MNPQLQRIAAELREVQARLHRLQGDVPAAIWPVRPSPDRWSVSECVDHLNRTAEAFIPLLQDALRTAPRDDVRPDRRYRRDPLGWLLSVILPPPVRLVRARTVARFEPVAVPSPERLVRRFAELHDQLANLLVSADGLPLDALRVQSPFDARVHYNVYSCFVIIPRHDARHLWQAEQAAGAVRGR